MKSGGQTKVTDIKVGRQLLCREKPNARATSECAKQLIKTVKTAKRGLTPSQQKLWRKYVYTSALLQAQRFCDEKASLGDTNVFSPGRSAGLTTAQKYKGCVNKVLTGKTKFKDLFGKKFKWADYLIKGAKIIKKLPTLPPNAWEQ